MTAKLPVILDNRNDNTVLNALRKLLPSLQKLDVATGVFEVGSLISGFGGKIRQILPLEKIQGK
jgi:hypothetical protein